MSDNEKKAEQDAVSEAEASAADERQSSNDNQPDATEDQEQNEASEPVVSDAEKLKELNEKFLRTLADVENMRRRHERELDDARKFASTGFARDLLDVADNMRRALSSVPKEAQEESDLLKTLVAGVEITERSLLTTFEKHKINKVEPEKGEKFDPNKHQAMFEVPTNDLPAGVVAEVMQAGYVIADRLLRPAMVGVTKAQPQAAQEQKSAQNNAAEVGAKVDTSA